MTISPKCPSSDRGHRKEKLLRSPWTSYPTPSGTECIKLYHSQTSQKHIRKLLSKPRNNEIYNNLRKDLFLLGPLYYTFLHLFPHIHLSLKGWNMPSPNQGCWDKLCLPTTFPMVSASRKETPHTTRATSLEHVHFLIPRTSPEGDCLRGKSFLLFRTGFVSIWSLESFLACPFYRGQQPLFPQGITVSCLDTSLRHLTFVWFRLASYGASRPNNIR